jgi:hypothetical protein
MGVLGEVVPDECVSTGVLPRSIALLGTPSTAIGTARV